MVPYRHRLTARIPTPRDLAVTLAAAVAICLLLSGVSARADVKVPAGIGPVAQKVEVRVPRGGEVPVALLASAPAAVGALEFSIFEQPVHGELGEITVRDGVNGAKVIYRHSASASASSDSFTFRARIRRGRFSLPTTVTVVVVEPSPKLDMANLLDFGKVPMLGAAQLDLAVVNRGNGAFVANLRLPPPFRLESPRGKITIPPGEVLRISVAYVPDGSLGEASYPWVLQENSPNGRVLLRGTSFAPFQLDADHLVLRSKGDSTVRRGVLRVSNPGSEAIRVAVTVPPRITASAASLDIPAESVAELSLELAAEDVASLEDSQFELAGTYHRQQVKLSAPLIPAKLEVDADAIASLHFPVKHGEKVVNKLVVKNIGGTKTYVSATVNPPFRIIEGQGGIALAAGDELVYHLELSADQMGSVLEVLKIEGGDGSILIPLRGHVTMPPEAMNRPVPTEGLDAETADGEVVVRESILTRYLVVGKPEAERATSDKVPSVERAWFVSGDRRSITFDWNQPPGGPWDYVVETEVHRVDEGTKLPYPFWIELSSDYAKVSKIGQRARAEIKGLEPGGKYTFRLLTKAADETFSASGERLVFVTEQPLNLFGWFRLWMVAALLVAGGAACWLWQWICYMRELYIG